jgi:hypothetical protein
MATSQLANDYLFDDQLYYSAINSMTKLECDEDCDNTCDCDRGSNNYCDCKCGSGDSDTYGDGKNE